MKKVEEFYLIFTPYSSDRTTLVATDVIPPPLMTLLPNFTVFYIELTLNYLLLDLFEARFLAK